MSMKHLVWSHVYEDSINQYSQFKAYKNHRETNKPENQSHPMRINNQMIQKSKISCNERNVHD